MWALIEEGGIWVSILRPSMFSLEIVERTRLKIKTAWFLLTSSAGGGGGGGGGGGACSLSRARFAFVQCSPIFQKKKKTTSVNRLEDKGKQPVQFLRHQSNKYIF